MKDLIFYQDTNCTKIPTVIPTLIHTLIPKLYIRCTFATGYGSGSGPSIDPNSEQFQILYLKIIENRELWVHDWFQDRYGFSISSSTGMGAR